MAATLAQGLSPVREEFASGAVVICQQTAMTPAVTISAAFRAGSIFDPLGLDGLAYLTGKVIDHGTERRTAGVIAEELDSRGVSLKVSTGRPMLTISCTCLSEDFDDVLAIVVDLARRPTFPLDEIEKRRAEVLTALRQKEDNPAARVIDAVLELLYSPQHPYGRPMKGTAPGVERVMRSDMVAFHAARIRPAALSLVIVGDVAPHHALARAAAELDGWNGERPDVPVIPPPPPAARRRRFIAMPGKPQTELGYGFVTIRRDDPRFYAYWMMNNILGEFGLGGRLADNIRERQGMAYYAFSTLESGTGEGPLLIRAGVDPMNVERALTAIDDEVRTLGAQGPTGKELDETRAYLVGSIPRLLETNQSIAAFLQSSEEFGLGLDFDQRLPGLLAAVTMDEVRTAAVETLDPSKAVIALAGPSTGDLELRGDPEGRG